MHLKADYSMVKIDAECRTTQFVGNITGEILQLLPYQETSEVVLTGERLKKNKRHHRDVDDEAYQLLPEIVANPDYVCIDKHDKQVVAFYYYRYENHYLRAVILLKAPQDPPHYKNSIQSFRMARRRELQKDIDSGRLIYSKKT